MPLLNLPNNQDNSAQTDPVNGVKVYDPKNTVSNAAQPVQDAAVENSPTLETGTDISDNLQGNLGKLNETVNTESKVDQAITSSPAPVQQNAPEPVQIDPAPVTPAQPEQAVQTNIAPQPVVAQPDPIQIQADPAAVVAESQPTANTQAQQTPSGTIQTNEKDFSLAELLQSAIAKEASDIHLSVGNRGILRIDGELERMSTKVLTQEYMESIIAELLKQRPGVKIEEISQYDMGYDLEGHRFRVNIFKQQGRFTVVARLVPSEIKTIEELGLPPVLKDLGNVSGGLVLVTGPTGSGKSTTLAAILNNINITQTKHIITVEDPVEFIFPKGSCLINQREFGLDFDAWPEALRSILRQDPDIVLVGEMRDLETISSAITLSETGHLVFATLHTNSASQTMDRMIDVFPEGQQSQIRAQLANVITAVIAQRLIPLAQGGRRAVMEIMLANPAVRNTIREGKTHQIDNMIQTGQDMGMVSMSRALVELVNQGAISVDTAQSYAPHPEELESLLKSMG